MPPWQLERLRYALRFARSDGFIVRERGPGSGRDYEQVVLYVEDIRTLLQDHDEKQEMKIAHCPNVGYPA
jgi:hypothetical protein